jgi:hypothetical protein
VPLYHKESDPSVLLNNQDTSLDLKNVAGRHGPVSVPKPPPAPPAASAPQGEPVK